MKKIMFIGNFSGNGSIFNQSIVFDRTNNCDNCSVFRFRQICYYKNSHAVYGLTVLSIDYIYEMRVSYKKSFAPYRQGKKYL